MSACDASLSAPIRPYFELQQNALETTTVQHLINALHLQKHPEGGYYAETDRDKLRVPNPFLAADQSRTSHSRTQADDDSTRSASTTIYYMLTPASSVGRFHRNKGRTVHTLHKGRGRYVLIHADEAAKDERARVETFVVGHNVRKGERLQWVVDGDKYKASFLLPDEPDGTTSEGLLISEVIILSLAADQKLMCSRR